MSDEAPTVWQVMSRRVIVTRTGVVTSEHCVVVCATREQAITWVAERVDRDSKWGEIPHDERGAFYITEGTEIRGLVPG